tara:strand:+ start:1 stop:1038 length:1038 start_codon:yes stop_codon:yes gene_type:complete
MGPYAVVLPDFHPGEKFLNGSVIPSSNLLYINAIGGDIGCGVASIELPIQFQEVKSKLEEIYHAIYSIIPVGRRTHTQIDSNIDSLELFKHQSRIMTNSNRKTCKRQFGTLGSGNHFIEIQKTEAGLINIMVHTGSRNLGQQIMLAYSKKGEKVTPNNLVILEANSQIGQEYLQDMKFAMRYAQENRQDILKKCMGLFQQINPSLPTIDYEEIIDLPHNYISREEHFGKLLFVHHKGAIKIGLGEMGVIPGSMGTHSYIVMGKENSASYNSCSHGAGRKMSRAQAQKRISLSQFLEKQRDIICRKDYSVLDEAPQAYKDIDSVIKYQKNLIRVVRKVTPLVNIKG